MADLITDEITVVHLRGSVMAGTLRGCGQTATIAGEADSSLFDTGEDLPKAIKHRVNRTPDLAYLIRIGDRDLQCQIGPFLYVRDHTAYRDQFGHDTVIEQHRCGDADH